MQKIISLDIGSYSIKALEMVNTFKTYQLTNFYEILVDEDGEGNALSDLPELLDRLFKENKIEADQIVTAMPGQYISYRILPFQYSDPKKIEMTVEPTIEDLVPFDLSDMVISHQILGTQAGTNNTNVMAVMTKSTYISNFLTNLKKVGIDPKIIDVDSVSLYNLAENIEHPDDECYGILDLGHEKSSLCIISQGDLKMFRTIYVGGKFLTEFIAGELSLSFSEAQELKHSLSEMGEGADAGSDGGQFQLAWEHLMSGVDNIINELIRTIYAFKQVDKVPITKIYITGGTSKIKGIDNYIENYLHIPTSPLNVIRSDEDATEKLKDHWQVVPQSAAIGLRSMGIGYSYSKINLRRGEFSYSQNYHALFTKIGTFAKVAAVLVFILALNYGAKFFLFSMKSDDIFAQIKSEFRKSFPTASKKMRNYSDKRFKQLAIKRFKAKISDKKLTQEELEANLNSVTVLEILNVLSTNISENSKIDTERIKFSGNYIELKADTDSFETATKIANQLEASQFFNTVKEEKSYKKPGKGDIISFELRLTLKD